MAKSSARELNGHDIWDIKRFDPNTRWMIEFTDKSTYDEVRLFLSDAEYQEALQRNERHEIKIRRYAHVTEGHIIEFKPSKNHHRK